MQSLFDRRSWNELPQALLETWMLLEYADRGSLEQAIQGKRFTRKNDKTKLDMVRHNGRSAS